MNRSSPIKKAIYIVHKIIYQFKFYYEQEQVTFYKEGHVYFD